MENLNIPWAILLLIWVVNFAISWWNARSCGLVWAETKVMGGWHRFLVWCGAIMSASGFTWCYLILLVLGGYYAQASFLEPGEAPYLTPEAVNAALSLGYLIIVPGVLFTGIVIWIDSLVQAWRNRTFGNIAGAAWNTFANVHNVYSAMRGMPEAWGSVKDFFGGDSDSDDAKSKGILIVIVLVIVAIIGGIMTTWSIINHHAGTRPIPEPSRS
jgi:hypothetical protein